MKRDNYHHGDLRQALIDAGIHIIETEGVDALSLRRVATACGVSQAAPYAHFKNKAELVDGIKDHVQQELMESLSSSLDGKNPSTTTRCSILVRRTLASLSTTPPTSASSSRPPTSRSTCRWRAQMTTSRPTSCSARSTSSY